MIKKPLHFTKMHALGNDFVVIDATQSPFSLSTEDILQLSDRRRGIGFDQMLVISEVERSDEAEGVADFDYRIFNADGSEVAQCGNGARCVAQFIVDHGLLDQAELTLRTKTRLLIAKGLKQGLGEVTVEMGQPEFLMEGKPGVVADGEHHYQYYGVDVGNPHAVILADEMDESTLIRLAKASQTMPCFPDGVNVSVMCMPSADASDQPLIELRVFERGAGLTMACGSAACAAAVVAIRLGKVGQQVCIRQPGGDLTIRWQGGRAPIEMTGEAVTVYQGQVILK